MKKRLEIGLLVIIIIFSLTACTNKEAIDFKKDYESLNNVVNQNDKKYRAVTIPKNNPFVKSNASEIIEKISSGEKFYVYFGSPLCPWCRSIIEKSVEIANNNGIDKIYYVDIWDEEGKEILRDKYILDDSGKAIKTIDGTNEYTTLLEYLDEILPTYTYSSNKNGGVKLDVDEKRLYIPLFVYISKGKPVRSTNGLSELQIEAQDELTPEIIAEEEKLFDDFFINVCDESC